MPDEDIRTPEPTAPEPSATAGAAADELPSFADALRAQSQQTTEQPAEAALNGDDTDDDDADDSDSAEEAPHEGLNPADAPAPDAERRPSRAERTRQEMDALKAERDTANQSLTELQTRMANSQREALQSLGSEDEWNRLVQKRLSPSEQLTYDEEERYEQLHAARTQAVTWRDMSRNAANMALLNGAKAKGLELDVPAHGLDPQAFIGQVIEAAEARARSDATDEIERLKADNESLLTKQAARSKDPGTGGRSIAGRSGGEPDFATASPSDLWSHALRSGNGRRH